MRASRESVDFISHLKSLPREMILDDEEKVEAEVKFSAETNEGGWQFHLPT